MTAEELAEYAGDYELAPGFVLTIYTEDDQIFGQATGQGSAEIFPSEKDEFFYTVVDAQLSFNRNDDGEIISLTLHQVAAGNGGSSAESKLAVPDGDLVGGVLQVAPVRRATA